MRFVHQHNRLFVVFRLALAVSLGAILTSIGVTVGARPLRAGPSIPTPFLADYNNSIQVNYHTEFGAMSITSDAVWSMPITPGTWYAFGPIAGRWRHNIGFGPIGGVAINLVGNTGWTTTDPYYESGIVPDGINDLNASWVPANTIALWSDSTWISGVAEVDPDPPGANYPQGNAFWMPQYYFQAPPGETTLYYRWGDANCANNHEGSITDPGAYNEDFMVIAMYPLNFDTQPPTTTHALGGTIGLDGWYTTPVTATLTGTDPSDPANYIPAAGVGTYYLDGAPHIPAAPGDPIDIPITQQGESTHTYYSADAASPTPNTESTVHSFTVKIDSVLPASAITAPADGSFIVGTVAIAGTASDATSGLDMVLVSTDGGANWPTATGTDNWSFDWDTTAVADGPYTIMASAADLAGNPEDPPASIGVSVDNLPPTTAITTAPAGWVNGTVTLAGTSADAGSSVASVAYSADGGATWYTAAGTDNWTVNWDTTTAPDGSVTVGVRGTDASGHTEAPPVEAVVQVDNAPPALTIIDAPSGWVTGVVTLAGTADDPHSGPAAVEYSLDDGLTWLPATGAAAWTFDVDTDLLPRGSMTILIRGADALGNTSAPTIVAFTIGVEPSDPPPGDHQTPDFDASWPGEWDIGCGPPSVDFTLSARDDGVGIKGIAVIISGSGIADRVLKGPAQNWSGALVWDGLDGLGNRVAPGVYHVWAGAWDHAGNTATREGTIRVTDCAVVAPIIVPPAPPPTETTTQAFSPPAAPTTEGEPPPAEPAQQEVTEVAEVGGDEAEQPDTSAITIPIPDSSTAEEEASAAVGAIGAGLGAATLLALSASYLASQEDILSKLPRTIVERVPQFVTRRVQTGTQVVVERTPRYEMRTVQKGWRTVMEQVPRYEVREVQEGWRTVKKRVPRYEMRTVRTGSRRVTRRVTEWVTRTIWEPVRRWLPGLGWITDWIRERVVEPVTRWVTRTEPTYEKRRVQVGWKTVTKRVPNMVTRKVQVGWDKVAKRVPNMVEQKVLVGYDVTKRVVPLYKDVTAQAGYKDITHTISEGTLRFLIAAWQDGKLKQALVGRFGKNVLKRVVVVGGTVLTVAALLSQCPQSTSTPTPTPSSDLIREIESYGVSIDRSSNWEDFELEHILGYLELNDWDSAWVASMGITFRRIETPVTDPRDPTPTPIPDSCPGSSCYNNETGDLWLNPDDLTTGNVGRHQSIAWMGDPATEHEMAMGIIGHEFYHAIDDHYPLTTALFNEVWDGRVTVNSEGSAEERLAQLFGVYTATGGWNQYASRTNAVGVERTTQEERDFIAEMASHIGPDFDDWLADQEQGLGTQAP